MLILQENNFKAVLGATKYSTRNKFMQALQSTLYVPQIVLKEAVILQKMQWPNSQLIKKAIRKMKQ